MAVDMSMTVDLGCQQPCASRGARQGSKPHRAISALAVALAYAALLAGPALALTDPASVAKGYKAPRDAWGHPDLAGTWSPATITRLERDPKLGERLVLSEAEAKAAEGDIAANNVKASLPTDQKLKVDEVDCGVKGFSG